MKNEEKKGKMQGEIRKYYWIGNYSGYIDIARRRGVQNVMTMFSKFAIGIMAKRINL